MFVSISPTEDIDKTLTENLGKIVEITGALRITRSDALLTLHFFQNLTIVGSENIGPNRCVP